MISKILDVIGFFSKSQRHAAIDIVLTMAALGTALHGQSLPLPVRWKKCIVPIQQDTIVDGLETLITVGTGFVVRDERGMGHVVTCRHVVEGRSNLFIGMHVKGSDATVAVQVGVEGFDFVYHSNPAVDLAISAIPATKKLEYDVSALSMQDFFSAESIQEGEDVLFLGFPMAIGGESVTPVCRFGIVALARESDPSFLIDGNVFPGNSGSPVFLRPSIYDFREGVLGAGPRTRLIGVLNVALTYRDIAISAQTGKPRVIFEENAGLAGAIPTSYLIEILQKTEKE